MPTFDYKTLKGYFEGDSKHYYYEDSVKGIACFRPHSEGVYPERLIEGRRPNEPLEVKEYRKEIWVPKTLPTFTKIINSLNKIRRSPDWSIKYPENSTEFGLITEEETLQAYCEEYFPYFYSVTNWIFAICLKKYLTDGNAVCMVMPLNTDEEITEYPKPFPIIFDCCDVLDYDEDNYAVLRDPAGSTYYTDTGSQQPGDAFYVVDNINIYRYEQVDAKKTINLVMTWAHGLPVLPIFKLGGIICKSSGKSYLYDSRIAGILPELDEALREYSDTQAAKVLHVYPERWEYTSNECIDCAGTGKRRNPLWFDGCGAEILVELPCDTCHGHGFMAAGPYAKIMVKPPSNMQPGLNIPTPPAGFIQKDVEIVKLMEQSVRDHIYYALAAINFQFLEQTPLSQSGTAKEVDKDELNNTVHAIAEDIVKIMDRIYKLNAYYRYKGLYKFEAIDDMLPEIPVPEKYDLLSTSNLLTELAAAKTGKVNPVIQNAMEVEYATKKFNTESEVKDLVALVLTLDPLPNVAEDDKMSRLSNKGITQETYIISSNITEFVQRAIDADEAFADTDLTEQKKVMSKYAQEILTSLDGGKKIIADATMNGLTGGTDQPLNGDGQQPPPQPPELINQPAPYNANAGI